MHRFVPHKELRLGPGAQSSLWQSEGGMFHCIQSSWWIVIGSRYGLRGVRLGEARNPDPPRILRRPSVHSNRFEILSSDDEPEMVPSPVPASGGAIRMARRRILVILSDSIQVGRSVPPSLEFPPSTIPDGSEDAQHHIIGTPRCQRQRGCCQ